MTPFLGIQGTLEKLDILVNPPAYRFHIGRSYTAFYQIESDQKNHKNRFDNKD